VVPDLSLATKRHETTPITRKIEDFVRVSLCKLMVQPFFSHETARETIPNHVEGGRSGAKTCLQAFPVFSPIRYVLLLDRRECSVIEYSHCFIWLLFRPRMANKSVHSVEAPICRANGRIRIVDRFK